MCGAGFGVRDRAGVPQQGRCARAGPVCRDRAMTGPLLSSQVNGAAQGPGSVATGTLSALFFALALAAGAGVAYYCVRRRRQQGQFGYYQVRASRAVGSAWLCVRGRHARGSPRAIRGRGVRGAPPCPHSRARAAPVAGRSPRGRGAGGGGGAAPAGARGLARRQAPPTAAARGHPQPAVRRPRPRLRTAARETRPAPPPLRPAPPRAPSAPPLAHAPLSPSQDPPLADTGTDPWGFPQ